MGKLANLQKTLESFKPDKTLSVVLSKTQDPESILRDRLMKEGTDAKGKEIRTYKAKPPNVYSLRTIAIKEAKRQITKHVTLKDTGQFHKTIVTELFEKYFQFEGDTNKEDGKIEDNVDLTNVLNLSTENKNELVRKIRPGYVAKTREIVGL